MRPRFKIEDEDIEVKERVIVIRHEVPVATPPCPRCGWGNDPPPRPPEDSWRRRREPEGSGPGRVLLVVALVYLVTLVGSVWYERSRESGK